MRKTIKTHDAELIASHVAALRKDSAVHYTTTLVLASDGIGYEVGIADKDVKGYTATGLIVDMSRYDLACDVVDKVNEILFPGRSKKTNMIIQLSTLSPGTGGIECGEDYHTPADIPETNPTPEDEDALRNDPDVKAAREELQAEGKDLATMIQERIRRKGSRGHTAYLERNATDDQDGGDEDF